jgi:hypothetical protein
VLSVENKLGVAVVSASFISYPLHQHSPVMLFAGSRASHDMFLCRWLTSWSAAAPLLTCLRSLLLLPAELMDLRQKFEEGRKRLAALKAARHFRPN